MIISRYENARVIPVMDFINYEFNGNKSEFSRVTGISRSTLREQSHLIMLSIKVIVIAPSKSGEISLFNWYNHFNNMEKSMNTAHFKNEELACKHCGGIKPDQHLMAVLQLVRVHFNKPVIVTSGYRCETHNAKVGGASNSKHVEGIAADIKVKGIEPNEVYHFLDSIFPNCYGIGLYSSWVHIDVRKNKARWES